MQTKGTHELAQTDMIFVPEAQWLRINFNSARLGDASYIELTSLLDGGTQILDANTIQHWNYRSAYFNGDAVEIKVFAGAGDKNVFVDIREVTVGEWPGFRAKSICGSADNRTSSNDSRVGRIVPVGCTGWIVDNGKHVTAGHCIGSSADTLQFNVPTSNPDRTLNHPGPEDQYPIISSTWVYRDRGVGDDWGVFSVQDNSNTGLQPIDAQNASFTVAQDLGPNTIRITGFGVDDGSDNQTNQTHSGSNMGSSGTTMRYNADTTGGNSGSPVIDEATNMAVGVHSHGGCSSTSGNNSGTSFFNSNFWQTVTGTGPSCAPAGASCSSNSDCCSNKCRGRRGAKSCR